MQKTEYVASSCTRANVHLPGATLTRLQHKCILVYEKLTCAAAIAQLSASAAAHSSQHPQRSLTDAGRAAYASFKRCSFAQQAGALSTTGPRSLYQK